VAGERLAAASGSRGWAAGRPLLNVIGDGGY
jgi:hypothetical protein